jgi:cation diffusion facilitator family transporter
MQQITLLGGLLNIALALAKIIVGLLGQSKALVVDGLHSLADLVSDVLVLVVTRLANAKADAEHPYGHQRIETVATVALGLLLVATGSIMAWESSVALWQWGQGQALPPLEPLTFWVALLSLLIKEWLFQRTLQVAQATQSNLLVANAWHHRSDALSSLVVLLGIGGALVGFYFLDIVAALLVALLIAGLGIQQITQSIDELIDSALPTEELEKILSVIKSVPGVIAVPRLRSRRMGTQRLLDAHIIVSPYLRTSESHYISKQIEAVLQAAALIDDVLLHIESEYAVDNAQTLPLRTEIVQILQERCGHLPHYHDIEDLSLHYFEDKILVELSWPWAVSQERPIHAWTLQYRQALADLPWLKDLRYHFVVRHFGKQLHYYRAKANCPTKS